MFWGMRPSTPYVQRNGSIWRSIAACVGHHDLFPTLLDLALIRWTGEAMGQSLASHGSCPPRLTYALGDKLTGDADAVR